MTDSFKNTLTILLACILCQNRIGARVYYEKPTV